jgi:hypothetical protein
MSILRNTLVVLMFVPAAAFACYSDRDCPVAAHCDRTPDQESGMCIGGMLPSEPFKEHLHPDPLNRAETNSGGCVADADCGFSGQCRRTAGQMRGVCMSGIGGVISSGGMTIPH